MKQTRVIYQNKNCYYIKPPLLLAPYIAHYTFQFGSKGNVESTNQGSKLLTVLPDASGCIVMTYDGNELSGYFWGPTTKAVIVGDDRTQVPLRMFIEFMPGGVSQFIRLNQDSVTDLQMPLEELNKTLEKDLKILIEAGGSLDEVIKALDTVLFKYFTFINQTQSNKVTPLLPYLRQNKGILTVKDLSEYTFYSPRHLNRLFNESLGINVKTYLRLLRINNAVKQINSSPKELTEIAQFLGYYDQAHFIHDFRAVVGVSPKAYRENMSVFYNENYKF